MKLIYLAKIFIFIVMIFGATGARAITVFPGPGIYTYQGPSTLSQGSFDLNCTLTLVGDVSYTSAGGIEIKVINGSSSGYFGLCEKVGFEFPWTAIVDPVDVPVSADAATPITFENVRVRGLGGWCTSSPVDVSAIFSPVNPSNPSGSSFTFSATMGNCGVLGSPANNSVYATNP